MADTNAPEKKKKKGLGIGKKVKAALGIKKKPKPDAASGSSAQPSAKPKIFGSPLPKNPSDLPRFVAVAMSQVEKKGK